MIGVSLFKLMKELQSGMPTRQPKLDFETSVIAGRVWRPCRGVRTGDFVIALSNWRIISTARRATGSFDLRAAPNRKRRPCSARPLARMAKGGLKPYRLYQSPQDRQYGDDEPDLKSCFDADSDMCSSTRSPLMEDFIDSAALFSDVFRHHGMKIVLSGLGLPGLLAGNG